MPYLIGTLFLVLALALVGVPILLSRCQSSEVNLNKGWTWGTRYFLVLLRLVIGWHFLVEGLDKLQSATWSSEAYLREASGPLAPVFRSLAGDSLVERLTPGPNNEFPPALAADWNNYFTHFKAYYSLNEDQAQWAELVVQQSMSKTLTWMTVEPKLIPRPLPQGPPLLVSRTVPERLQDLQKADELVRSIEENERPNFGKKTFAKLAEAKEQARRIRTELRGNLKQQTADMKKALAQILTGGQKTLREIGGGVGAANAVGLAETLSAEQKMLPPMPDPVGKSMPLWNLLDWSDHIVKYGLVLVGGLLLLGLLTRTACVAGALFLLMFFLAMPPLPDWPEAPRVEGHYLYINKNIIEMLALGVLATTRSGRWAGLDGLVQFLNPRRYSKRQISDSEVLDESARRDLPPVAHAPGSPIMEKSHGS